MSRGRRAQRERCERGAGTVLAVALTAVLLLVGLGAAGAVAIVGTHRIAQSAADLAALAGAAALQDGGGACQRAAGVAARNHARLTGCVVDGWEVAVRTEAAGPRLLHRVVTMSARSRAGPTTGRPSRGRAPD